MKKKCKNILRGRRSINVIAFFEKAALCLIMLGLAVFALCVLFEIPVRWFSIRLPQWMDTAGLWMGLVGGAAFLSGFLMLFAEFLGKGIARHIRITFDGKPLLQGIEDYFNGLEEAR